MNTHVWLTLPSLKVIDVTIFHTMIMRFMNPKNASQLPPIIKFDENHYGNGKFNVELHPILVGEKTLDKIFITKVNLSETH